MGCIESTDWTEGWDRTFLNASSALAEPVCSAYSLFRYRMVAPLYPGRFDTYPCLTKEVAYRAILGLGALLSVSFCAAAPLPAACGIAFFACGSKLMRAIGLALQKDGFTHVRGRAPEKDLEGRLKVMNWNVCGIAGGFHYDHCGVVDWKSRFQGIAKKIETENPDVLVLEEIYDAALGEKLIERLKDKYAHFYFHMGKTVFGSVGGIMVLSKCAPYSFTHTEFETNDWTLKRGFAALEIKARPSDRSPCARIIGTHFIHGDEPTDRAGRVRQLAQMVDHLAKETFSLPTLLAGDLNIERDGEEGRQLLPFLEHGYKGPDATCTNRLVAQWDCKAKSVWSETIDYISLFKERKELAVSKEKAEFETCYLSPAFDNTFNTRTALSDHHAVVATVNIDKPIASQQPAPESEVRQRPFTRFG